jgi:hypothetical protein
MGYGRELPWFLVVALCAALPVYVAVQSYTSASTPVVLVIGALMSLACGLLVLSWVVVHHTHMARRDVRRLAAEITALMRESREEERVSAELAAQVSILRSEVEALGTSVNVSVNEMRQGHAAIANDMRNLAERQYHYQTQMQQHQLAQQTRRPVVVHPSQWAPGEGIDDVEDEAPVVLPPRAGSLDDMSSFADAVVISLEPVIDLFSGKTAHYRLHHAFEGAEKAAAERQERRPALDIYLYREALVLLRRLRKRDNRLGILVPISSMTLAIPDALSRLAQLHASEPGVSEGSGGGHSARGARQPVAVQPRRPRLHGAGRHGNEPVQRRGRGPRPRGPRQAERALRRHLGGQRGQRAEAIRRHCQLRASGPRAACAGDRDRAWPMPSRPRS